VYELDAHTEGLRMLDRSYRAVEGHSPLGKVSNGVGLAPAPLGAAAPAPLGAAAAAPLGAALAPLDSLYLPCLV